MATNRPKVVVAAVLIVATIAVIGGGIYSYNGINSSTAVVDDGADDYLNSKHLDRHIQAIIAFDDREAVLGAYNYLAMRDVVAQWKITTQLFQTTDEKRQQRLIAALLIVEPIGEPYRFMDDDLIRVTNNGLLREKSTEELIKIAARCKPYEEQHPTIVVIGHLIASRGHQAIEKLRKAKDSSFGGPYFPHDPNAYLALVSAHEEAIGKNSPEYNEAVRKRGEPAGHGVFQVPSGRIQYWLWAIRGLPEPK